MVKAGYKQTEIGVIPEDWKISTIKEHCNIQTGNKNTQDRLDDGIYPFFVRSQTIEKINSYAFDGEAVLTAGDGVGTGKVHHYINGKFDFHQRVYCMNNFSDSLDGYFFYLYFKHNFYGRISQMTAKSSVDSVRKEMISNMTLPIPPKEEQKAIANALSDVDALITSLEKLIAKKESIKTATMQQLLTGKKRLNGFSGEWEEKKLGEISEMSSGGTPSTKIAEYYNGQISWLSISDITKAGKYVNLTEKSITEKGLQNSSAKLFNKGILFLAMYASIGKCCIAKIHMATSQAILGIDTGNKLDTEFLYYYFLSIQNKLANSGQQGTQSNLNKGIVEDILIKLPTLEEQQAIAQILSDMDNEIEALKNKLSKTKAIKDGMMSELLSGKTRLKV